MTVWFRLLALGALIGCTTVRRRPHTTSVTRPDMCASGSGRAGTIVWAEARVARATNHELPIVPLGQLVGVIVDHDGHPIGSARVALQRSARPSGDSIGVRGTFTGADGTFRFDSIESLSYLLDIVRIGYERQWHEYRGVPGVADTLCVPMRAVPLILGPLVPAVHTTGAASDQTSTSVRV